MSRSSRTESAFLLKQHGRLHLTLTAMQQKTPNKRDQIQGMFF